jgi:type III pantothenate kinase
MKVDVVVDVGNTRIKWGRCAQDSVTCMASLSSEPDEWESKIKEWGLIEPGTWAVASVQPQRSDALVTWLRRRGNTVWVVDSAAQLPLNAWVPNPQRVGIDRLLNAVAAVRHPQRRRIPAIVIDAGSAVTVDWVGAEGNFAGGAIFPGLRLMAQALHDYTALLPVVEFETSPSYLPGRTTQQAMQAGIYYAVTGGINRLIGKLAERSANQVQIFLTGGDAVLLKPEIDPRAEYWPLMTLEGLRLTAEAQPQGTPPKP